MSRCNRINIAHYSFAYIGQLYFERQSERLILETRSIQRKSFYDMILKLLLHQTIVAIDISLQYSSSQF